MRAPYAYLALFLGAAVCLSGPAAAGPAGGGFHVPNSGMTSGGGVTATGGGYAAAGSMGGPSATKMSGGGFSLSPGIVASQRPAAEDLSAAHPYPVPFIPTQGHDKIIFTRLTARVTIRIYTLSGELVKTINKDSAVSDRMPWTPVANEQGEPLASGVYLYHIQSTDGKTASGKLMVIK
ncbi:MAG: T9SS type A sorting domain-containing protein [Elusimicrobia bacterium]|nr:T9SS type A sorting domain-containing protein [Elusimicrobiota bacterium]